ncbi:exosporium leader peptide-containing protein [Bacillus cereus group sp. MYBK163-2]|uniref:exosporium leader peptide-containing protein n=1 Tax=Bacillus cereus group TaxID=86661 RepID=UPI001E429363|nr:exosporium leader peptide-containing protein [Bacillus cereus]MCU5431183.1 hypothetical protein [Bacillus cereus]
MSNKNEHDSKWLDSYKLLFAAALDSSAVGPTFPPILPHLHYLLGLQATLDLLASP